MYTDASEVDGTLIVEEHLPASVSHVGCGAHGGELLPFTKRGNLYAAVDGALLDASGVSG